MLVSTEITGQLPSGVTKSFVNRILAVTYRTAGGTAKVQISVSVVGDKEMRRLNLEHRGKDTTTDVLSFAYQESEEFIDCDNGDENSLLGEIVISAEQVRRQAKQIGRKISAEFALMLIHGVLHLLGYDHVTLEDENEMFCLQQDIMLKAGII
ncbi:MAG: rRNA maturation RNase YbeY [Patescibacteria group bacterium]